ncbi:MAG: hypothetical protein H7Y41_06585 [Hyphomonadaceae bacterium]|nr:hypothetical protein [Clostridia bacterium]
MKEKIRKQALYTLIVFAVLMVIAISLLFVNAKAGLICLMLVLGTAWLITQNLKRTLEKLQQQEKDTKEEANEEANEELSE